MKLLKITDCYHNELLIDIDNFGTLVALTKENGWDKYQLQLKGCDVQYLDDEGYNKVNEYLQALINSGQA